MILRDAQAGDLNFIIATWLRSFRASRIRKPDMTDDIYWSPWGHRGLVIALMAAPQNRTVVVGEADGDVIHGWCCRSDSALHYVYVREEVRRAGVCTMLLGDGRFQSQSHVTGVGNRAGLHYPYVSPYRANEKDDNGQNH